MAKKRSVKSKKSKISKKDPKNLLYVIGTAVVILVLFAVVFMYSGKPLVGKAFVKTLDNGNQIIYDLYDAAKNAGTQEEGALPAKLVFKADNEMGLRVLNDDNTISFYNVKFDSIELNPETSQYQIQGLEFDNIEDIPPVNEVCEGTNCPELGITDFTIIPDEAAGTITLMFMVSNNGNAAVPTVEIMSGLATANHEIIFKEILGNGLAAASTQPVEIVFTPGVDLGLNGEIYTFSQFYDPVNTVGLSAQIMVDPNHIVLESNEQNNFELRCIAGLSCYTETGPGTCNEDGGMCIGQVADPFCGDSVCNGDETVATCAEDCQATQVCPVADPTLPCTTATLEDGTCTAIDVCTTTCSVAQPGASCSLNYGATEGTCQGGVCVEVIDPGACTAAEVTASAVCTIPDVEVDGICLVEGFCSPITCGNAVCEGIQTGENVDNCPMDCAEEFEICPEVAVGFQCDFADGTDGICTAIDECTPKCQATGVADSDECFAIGGVAGTCQGGVCVEVPTTVVCTAADVTASAVCTDPDSGENGICITEGICTTTVCGDGTCDGDETAATCPEDCEDPANEIDLVGKNCILKERKAISATINEIVLEVQVEEVGTINQDYNVEFNVGFYDPVSGDFTVDANQMTSIIPSTEFISSGGLKIATRNYQYGPDATSFKCTFTVDKGEVFDESNKNNNYFNQDLDVPLPAVCGDGLCDEIWGIGEDNTICPEDCQ
jgi:hypothetical protein